MARMPSLIFLPFIDCRGSAQVFDAAVCAGTQMEHRCDLDCRSTPAFASGPCIQSRVFAGVDLAACKRQMRRHIWPVIGRTSPGEVPQVTAGAMFFALMVMTCPNAPSSIGVKAFSTRSNGRLPLGTFGAPWGEAFAIFERLVIGAIRPDARAALEWPCLQATVTCGLPSDRSRDRFARQYSINIAGATRRRRFSPITVW